MMMEYNTKKHLRKASVQKFYAIILCTNDHQMRRKRLHVADIASILDKQTTNL